MEAVPYLFFDGRCEEAIAFYKAKLGAAVGMMLRFKDSPDPAMTPPGADDKIMHAHVTIGKTSLLASDGHCSGAPKFAGFALSLTVADEAEAQQRFAALSDGGQVQAPLSKTFFSPSFGIVTDKFGLSWMVYVEQAQ